MNNYRIVNSDGIILFEVELYQPSEVSATNAVSKNIDIPINSNIISTRDPENIESFIVSFGDTTLLVEPIP